MSLGDIYAELREHQMWAQFQDTFGHLRPARRADYPGTLVVSNSDYNDQGVSIVHAEFALEDSPWLYASMNDFAYKSMRSRGRGIWEFRGVCRACKNGKLRFIGKWTKMSLYPGRIPATKPRRHWGRFAYTGKPAPNGMRESDLDYVENNIDAVVRFLDTMNARRAP